MCIEFAPYLPPKKCKLGTEYSAFFLSFVLILLVAMDITH